MNHHTFDPSSAEKLEETVRYRYLSRDELVGALELDGDERVVDLGSGTGFYTREVAPYAGTVHAVDLQEEMHDFFRENGIPDTVEPVTAAIDDVPFEDESHDAAYSTMTFHEFVSQGALAELRRVLRTGARVVIVDWSSLGEGERGPPVDARYDAAEATSLLESAGFTVETARERPETFFVTATAD
ncbi:MAG: class I SAM-dependent methyltransferase [Halanaeroarchaeum sp.]